jgi:hypothetical protein
MDALEWFENSKFTYSLDEHDEGGFIGVNERKVAEMLDEYLKYKMSLTTKNEEIEMLDRKEEIEIILKHLNEDLKSYFATSYPELLSDKIVEYGIIIKKYQDELQALQ